MSIEKELGNFREVILNFRFFFILHDIHQLSMTLKIHVILDHYSYYFEKTKQTFKDTSREYIESCHSTLRKEEEEHNLKVVRRIGTPIHIVKSAKSLTIFLSCAVSNKFIVL